MEEERAIHRSGWHRLALLIPFVWQLGLAWLANRVSWQPFGLSFQMVWQMLGIPVASGAIAWVFVRDESMKKTETP